MKKARAALWALALWPCLATASEFGGSNYMPGFYGDFGMASLGPAGFYLNNFLGYYHASANGTGGDMLLDMPGLIGVTDWHALGGRFAWALYPAGMYSNATFAATPTSPRKFTEQAGAGDMYVVPAALNWEGEGWSLLAFQGIVPPSGNYSASRDLNLGRNYWSFDSNLSVTRLFAGGDFEFSGNVGIMVNAQNPATDYRTGTELHLDYLLGYHLNPVVSLGVAGSYYTQLEADSGKGVPDFLADGEAATIGPAAMATLKVGEGQELNLAAKWLHEVTASNHTPGDYVLVRTILGF